MEKTKLKKIYDIVDCMNDIGMLDSYWEKNMNKDISENLDYRIKSKSDDLDTTRKIAKLSNLLKSIKTIKMPI